MTKDDGYTRITLRIPTPLHTKLTELADERSRSTNAEIIGRLSFSVETINEDLYLNVNRGPELIKIRSIYMISAIKLLSIHLRKAVMLIEHLLDDDRILIGPNSLVVNLMDIVKEGKNVTDSVKEDMESFGKVLSASEPGGPSGVPNS